MSVHIRGERGGVVLFLGFFFAKVHSSIAQASGSSRGQTYPGTYLVYAVQGYWHATPSVAISVNTDLPRTRSNCGNSRMRPWRQWQQTKLQISSATKDREHGARVGSVKSDLAPGILSAVRLSSQRLGKVSERKSVIHQGVEITPA